MNLIKGLVVFILVLLSFSSCRKNKLENQNQLDALSNGMLVLNEGLFNLNNASLSWINLSNGIVNTSLFEEKTGRQLGDTGNDMFRYGDKLYIIVNVSSTIEVLDASSLKPIKQIPMINSGVSKQPRNGVAYRGKVYISCFDGYVDVIDTISLSIEKRIKVGSNPENLLQKDNFIYVSNSGGLNGPKLDSTISIIDTDQAIEIEKIVVGTNPGSLIEGGDNDIFVLTRGDYKSIPSKLKKVDLNTKKIIETYEFNCIGLEKIKEDIVVFDANAVHLFSIKENKITKFNFIDLKEVNTLYKVQYISENEHILLLDAVGYINTGNVLEFDVLGHFMNKYHVGLNPTKIIYYE